MVFVRVVMVLFDFQSAWITFKIRTEKQIYFSQKKVETQVDKLEPKSQSNPKREREREIWLLGCHQNFIGHPPTPPQLLSMKDGSYKNTHRVKVA